MANEHRKPPDRRRGPRNRIPVRQDERSLLTQEFEGFQTSVEEYESMAKQLDKVVHSSNIDFPTTNLAWDRGVFFGTFDLDQIQKASDRRKDKFVAWHAKRQAIRQAGGDPSSVTKP